MLGAINIPFSGVPRQVTQQPIQTTAVNPAIGTPVIANPQTVQASVAQPQSTIATVNPMQTTSMPLGGGQQVPATGLIGSEQALNEGLGALNTGYGEARNQIQGVLNEFNDPNAYKTSAATEYLLGQSQRAIERSAAARGGLLGGNVLQELQRNAMGLAAQDYQNQIGIKSNLAQSLANIAENAGIQTAGLKSAIGSGRYQAGRDIAQNANQAATQISNLLNQQGANISDMARKDISSITDMIYQSGLQNKLDSQQLATILANISGGQASQMSQGYQNLGAANAAGILGVGNAIQGGIQQGIATGVLG